MKKTVISSILLLLLGVGTLSARPQRHDKDTEIANSVARWQMKHFPDSSGPEAGWVHAAFYRGLIEWGEHTKSAEVDSFLMNVGRNLGWGMLERVYDADDLCIGQTYIRLFNRYGKPEMTAKVKQRMDYVMANPQTESLRTPKNKPNRDRWGWCDALFMAPPVYAQMYKLTGDKKYLDFCHNEFRVTTDSLFDKKHGLYTRDLRFINDREANGNKVFWSRGNGWVYAGLTFMLNDVPKSHPSYKYYLDLYRRMTPAVAKCADKNGSWHAAMLDLDTYAAPENSASAFFVYGLAYGINRGLIDAKTYRPLVEKAWATLKSHVAPDGKLGYVQPIGHAPLEVNASMSAPYGVGAFLLAAVEMQKMKK